MGQRSFQVAGVDGCKAGWFVVVASAVKREQQAAPCALRTAKFFVAATFSDVLLRTTSCQLVCIDIPIGLSDGTKPRACDFAARKILGRGRASSIFPPPIRPCLSARDYETASQISFEYTGNKLSKQSFFIMNKIREVDQAMTPELQQRVREIHPELAFCALNGGRPVRHNKKKLAGRNERITLLSAILPNLHELIAEARKPKAVAPDDILDAVVAAWTAGQAVLGKGKTLPENPELDCKGLRMEIVYPAAI